MVRTKILLVDDLPENILALSSLIEADDVDILSATSGEQALELLLSHEVALALLDVQMPKMNGFELAQLMRGVERSRNIPIIFVTAGKGEKSTVFEGYEKGAVDFLIKPLDPHIVRCKVRIFVDLDQRNRTLREQLREKEESAAEMQKLKLAAEAANFSKSQFLANMSHEIRTPLGAILGFAELLEEPDLPSDETKKLVGTIIRNGRQLASLIDDILDISKIEAQKMQVDHTAISMPDLIKDMRALFGFKAAEKGLNFEIVTDGVIPDTIVSDPLRLRQILQNILSNAIKFTAKGSVKMVIALVGAQLKFRVEDSGCGVTPEQADRLFQPFGQADVSTSRKFGGTGLGLVIARQLARILNGDVLLLSSDPEKGSVFEVSIDPGEIDLKPLQDEKRLRAANKNQDNSALNLRGIKVLFVDDAPDNRDLVHRILGLAEAEVELASTGVEGVEKGLSGDFNVILMDIQMPEMDGYEATTRLRNSGFNKPILAVTAHTRKENLDQCLAVGCDDFVCKPINRNLLIQKIKEHLARPNPRRKPLAKV